MRACGLGPPGGRTLPHGSRRHLRVRTTKPRLRSSIIAAYSNAGANAIRVRDSAGTWSSPSLSVLSGDAWTTYDVMEYGGKAYIAGHYGNAAILSWDGADVVIARDLWIQGSGPGNEPCFALTVFNGELVFVWRGGQPS